MTLQVPHRRLRMTLDLEADSLSELARALIQISTDLEIDGREERNMQSGGVTNGYHLKVTCNPEMTPKRFADELLAWHADYRKATA